jgi:hypothetical protein
MLSTPEQREAIVREHFVALHSRVEQNNRVPF